jgi:hypothetical protein
VMEEGNYATLMAKTDSVFYRMNKDQTKDEN